MISLCIPCYHMAVFSPCVCVSLLFLNRQQSYWTLISPSTWEFESHVRHADHSVRATDDLRRLITMTRHDPFPLCNHPVISAINKQVIYTIGANYYPRTCVTDILEGGWGPQVNLGWPCNCYGEEQRNTGKVTFWFFRVQALTDWQLLNTSFCNFLLGKMLPCCKEDQAAMWKGPHRGEPRTFTNSPGWAPSKHPWPAMWAWPFETL